jgi:glycerol-1-phosphate dehydrogenase [NAD(P)+]
MPAISSQTDTRDLARFRLFKGLVMIIGSSRLALAVNDSENVAEVLLERGASREAGTLFLRHFAGKPACLFADENTWAAAGAEVERALVAKGIVVRHHILPATPRPKPSVELAGELGQVLALDDGIAVAIGSGVINDLVKHAAFTLGRPYLCVATAVSMDGYTSAGAPLSVRGFKKTIQCKPPVAVLADLDVLANAPAEMTSWGYSDLAGKVAAGADWILADALGIEPVDPGSWSMVQDELRNWLGRPAQVKQGDAEALAGLFSGLAMVGFAMERHGSSRPASGSDHQIAHLWEMEGLAHKGEAVSHGACVAIGTLSVVALYEWLLASCVNGIDAEAVVASAPNFDGKVQLIHAAFGAGEMAERAIEETRAKHLEKQAHRDRLRQLVAAWPALSRRLEQQLPGLKQVQGWLDDAGAPRDAASIGVTREHLHNSILNARFLRSRYTVLDVLEETGLLPQAASRVAGLI